MDEVPLPQRPLLAFDDEQSLAGEDEKVFLVRLPVVHRPRPARPDYTEGDADLRELRLALEAQAHCLLLDATPARVTRAQD